ncbi:hypothetical protein AAVH_22411 [Aphelenchoides avenae]|nr:hypothetical protein AAVH_22411 [Aphelenchus avenae]
MFQFGIFLDFWEGNEVASRGGYLLSAYFSYFQCFAHVVIAVKRFTCFAYPDKYKKWWNTRNFCYITLLTSFLPLPFMSFRFPAKSMYFYVGQNQLGNRYLEKEVQFVSHFRDAFAVLKSTPLSPE